MKLVNLKDDIFIEGFDKEYEFRQRLYGSHGIAYSVDLWYQGKTDDVTEEEAREFTSSKYGETTINGEAIYTFKDYNGIRSRLYTFEVSHPVSEKQLDEWWDMCGRPTTQYFYSKAKDALKSACDKEYCIIYRIK